VAISRKSEVRGGVGHAVQQEEEEGKNKAGDGGSEKARAQG